MELLDLLCSKRFAVSRFFVQRNIAAKKVIGVVIDVPNDKVEAETNKALLFTLARRYMRTVKSKNRVSDRTKTDL